MYQVINTRTGLVVATCRSAQAARNKRDRLDLAYGAAVHVARPV